MRRLRLAAVAVIYAGKVTLLSGCIKVILKLSLSVPRYSWITSYAPIFACCFWDTLIFSVAMERVNLVAAVGGRYLVAVSNGRMQMLVPVSKIFPARSDRLTRSVHGDN